jgi:hypothetical protein
MQALSGYMLRKAWCLMIHDVCRCNAVAAADAVADVFDTPGSAVVSPASHATALLPLAVALW